MNFDLLEEMVRVPSPSGKESVLARFLRKEMKSRGFNARIDGAGNFIAEKGKGKPLVLLTAHMDTVPKQLPVKKTKTKLFGRGAVDTKASLFSFIEAATAINPEKGKIVVVGTVEEECPTNKGAYALAKSMKPDYCIVGEPSAWNSLTVGYKGLLDFTYSLELPETHFSSGSNASIELIEFVNALREKFEFENSFSAPSIEIREIISNNFSVRARIVIRIPPEFDIGEGKERIRKLAGNARLHWQQEVPAAVMQKNNSLVKAFLSAIRTEHGTPTFKKKTGTSDMNVLAKYWNCPMITYGPGDSHLDHSDSESIEFAEVKRAVAVLEGVLGKILCLNQ